MKHSIRRLLCILLFVAATVSAQPRVTLGPEVPVTGNFRRPTATAFGEWKAPAFAAAGRDGDYLVAWSEYDAAVTRASLVTAKIDATGAMVPGTRNAAPFSRETDNDAQFPAVAFDGERFLVAWVEGANAPRLVAMRFDRDGRPLDAVPFVISFTARLTYIAATAANGEFLVTHVMGGPLVSPAPAVARIAPDGTIRERDRIFLGTPGFWRDLESNGTSMLVATESSYAFPPCAIELCSSISFRALNRLPLAATQTSVAPLADTRAEPVPLGTGIATDGQRYLVVSWNRNEAIGQLGWFLRGQLTDPAGAKIVREFIVARDPVLPSSRTQGGRIDALWTGSDYAIAYEVFGATASDNKIDIRLTFASPTGMGLIDPVDVATSSEQERSPVLLPLGGGRVLVLYERGTPARPEIVARAAALSIRTRAVR